MSSLRQIEANRRNARLSTGPITEEGKNRSRRNAVRHRLTAETVIDALEDAEDYAAFEMAVTADYDAQSAVERELVLTLASLLWRLRRATAIEAGLFKQQARQLLRFRQRVRPIESARRSSTKCTETRSQPKTMCGRIRRPVWHPPQVLLINSMISHVPSSAYPTYRHIRLTGSVGMRPHFGARLARSCSRCNVSTAASLGRGLGCEQPAIAFHREAKPLFAKVSAGPHPQSSW
jgi:hypothetical protein